MLFSIIVPVYNRPSEVDELLVSFARQGGRDFEIVIVEDGSAERCDEVVARHSGSMEIAYFFKPNSGPGPTRNYGAAHSRGDYLLFLDSDCTVPDTYLDAVRAELDREPVDAFGGPDRAGESFTPMQKAIDYAMTSPLTTGGIRGRARSMDRFFPRSFNMGIRRGVFEAVGGFADMRFGEDIDLSYRIVEEGHTTRLFPGAWVWHKRRTNLRRFFKQVFNSGSARIVLSKRHPGTLRAVHAMPALFIAGCAALIVIAVWQPLVLLAFALFFIVITTDASVRTGSVAVGALSTAASFVQLTGYGSGFIYGWWRVCVLKKNKSTAFDSSFYK